MSPENQSEKPIFVPEAAGLKGTDRENSNDIYKIMLDWNLNFAEALDVDPREFCEEHIIPEKRNSFLNMENAGQSRLVALCRMPAEDLKKIIKNNYVQWRQEKDAKKSEPIAGPDQAAGLEPKPKQIFSLHDLPSLLMSAGLYIDPKSFSQEEGQAGGNFAGINMYLHKVRNEIAAGGSNGSGKVEADNQRLLAALREKASKANQPDDLRDAA